MTDQTNSLTTDSPKPLTLSGLQAGLQERGVKIGLSTLSELIALGDIAQQLGVGGDGSKREFHPDALEVLVAFLPAFTDAKRERGLSNKSAPEFLRGFLDQRNQTGLVPSGALVPQFGESRKLAGPVMDPLAVAEAQGRAQGLAATERVLTAKEAAEMLSITVEMLRETTKPWKRFGKSARGDRWLLSDLLRK